MIRKGRTKDNPQTVTETKSEGAPGSWRNQQYGEKKRHATRMPHIIRSF